MGMRFRKSFKIAPGVKLNLSKRGIGVSAGVKGARVSLNSKGRVTKSVGIPGTGISYVSSSKLGASKKKATAKKTSAKASTAFAAENPSADTTPTPPVSDNSSPTPGGKMNPKSILRWVIYIAVICIATQISKKMCYPSMLGCSICSKPERHSPMNRRRKNLRFAPAAFWCLRYSDAS